MNKKILLGSIIAVIIMVLVSFTGVVGYQTTKSSTIAKASPLFNIRTSRAIDKDSRDFTCDYVGQGEESVLSIPKRNDRNTLVQEFIDRVNKMDDKTLNTFTGLVIDHLKQKGQTDIDNAKIIIALNLLRTNQEAKDYILVNSENPRFYTEYLLECTFVNWKPFCIYFKLILLPFYLYDAIFFIVSTFLFFFICLLVNTYQP